MEGVAFRANIPYFFHFQNMSSAEIDADRMQNGSATVKMAVLVGFINSTKIDCRVQRGYLRLLIVKVCNQTILTTA
jgi:hypothetical protein